MKFLKWLSAMSEVLMELFDYSQTVAQGEQPDPDKEREIAGRILRKASDEQMHKELGLK